MHLESQYWEPGGWCSSFPEGVLVIYLNNCIGVTQGCLFVISCYHCRASVTGMLYLSVVSLSPAPAG